MAEAYASENNFVPQCAQTVAVVLVPVDADDNRVGQVIIAQVTVIEIPLACDFIERSTRVSFCCCLDSQTIELQKVWIGTPGETTLSITNGDAVVCAFTNTAPVVDPGCTSTQGYWKTHADKSKKQYDPTWDLLPNGPATTFFLSGQSYLQVMQAATKGNVYYILAQQYVAAVLNGLSGAYVPTEVADAIADATTNFFSLSTPAQAAKLSKEARAYWIGVAGLLDSYNNGSEGVPHCD